MRSLRKALAAQGIQGCPHGLMGLNPFYSGDAGTIPLSKSSFGFTRLSHIIDALRWPTAFVPLPDHPANDKNSWQYNPDGLAHDDVTWFFTSQDNGLMTIPLVTDMEGLGSYHFDDRHSTVPLGNGSTYSLLSTDPDNANDLIIEIDVPAGYDHMGGLTIQRLGGRSILYIPIQDNSGGGNPPMIYALESIQGQAIIDHNWRMPIPQPGDQAAWCAFDPVAGRLYTSAFFDVGGPPGSSVDVYAIGSPAQPDAGAPQAGLPFLLTFVGTMSLLEADGHTPATLHRIQSGFISPQRHLYLAQDDGTGLVGFDLITGRKRLIIPVDYAYSTANDSDYYQEIEGSCLFPNIASPGMSGDIHVQVYENGFFAKGEKLWIKHYGVADPDDRPFI